MTAKINLTQLRAIATDANLGDDADWHETENLEGYFGDEDSAHIGACSPATLLALIEIAEAAQAISDSLVDPDPEEARLLEALARIDFGEHPPE